MIFNRNFAGRLFAISWIGVCAVAQVNVTVDDQDPAIVYAPVGAWTLSANSSLDAGGAHMLTQNPNATATFQFTGVAIYFLAPKWPYNVNTAVSLDNGVPTLIDLVDHSRPDVGQGAETVQSAVVWNATGLNNTSHTLVVSVGPGQPFGVLDALIFTTLSADNTSTTAASSTSPLTSSSLPPSSSLAQPSPVVTPPPFAPANSDTATPTSKKRPVVQIALGSLFGFIALVAIILTVMYYCKRRNRPRSEAWTVDDGSNSGGGRTSYTYSSANGMRMAGPAQGAYTPTYGRMSSPQPTSSKYGYVGAPAPPPPPPHAPRYDEMYSVQHGGYAYDQPQPPPQGDGARAPNRYQPGYTLSTITEKSTPRMQDSRAELAAHTPASGQSELAYYTATPSDGGAAAGTQPRYEKDQRTAPPQKGSAHWI